MNIFFVIFYDSRMRQGLYINQCATRIKQTITKHAHNSLIF